MDKDNYLLGYPLEFKTDFDTEINLGDWSNLVHTLTFTGDTLSFMVDDMEYFIYTRSRRDVMPKDAALVGNGVQLNFIGDIEMDGKARRVKMVRENSPLVNVYINPRQEWFIEPYEVK